MDRPCIPTDNTNMVLQEEGGFQPLSVPDPSLLIVCPTRGRPNEFQRMLYSLRATLDFFYSKVLVLVDQDDPKLHEYKKVFPKWIEVEYCDEHEPGTTCIINKAFRSHYKYKYYCIINDDMVFDTPGWDKKLSKPGHISTGLDIFMVERHGRKAIGFPCSSVIDGDIVRALGWLQMPELVQGSGDNVWYAIARRLHILNFVKDVRYRHYHYYFGKSNFDDTYKITNTRESLLRDWKAYKKWLKYDSASDINQILENVDWESKGLKIKKPGFSPGNINIDENLINKNKDVLTGLHGG